MHVRHVGDIIQGRLLNIGAVLHRSPPQPASVLVSEDLSKSRHRLPVGDIPVPRFFPFIIPQ